MAFLRASFNSRSGPSAALPPEPARPWSSSLHDGQRLANPGLPGFNSNSSEQTTQTLIGKATGISVNGPLNIIADRIASVHWFAAQAMSLYGYAFLPRSVTRRIHTPLAHPGARAIHQPVPAGVAPTAPMLPRCVQHTRRRGAARTLRTPESAGARWLRSQTF